MSQTNKSMSELMQVLDGNKSVIMGDTRKEEELSKKAFKTSQKDIKLMSYQL